MAVSRLRQKVAPTHLLPLYLTQVRVTPPHFGKRSYGCLGLPSRRAGRLLGEVRCRSDYDMLWVILVLVELICRC